MTNQDSRLQRFNELLADRATEALSPPEQLELDRLHGELGGADLHDFDRAAAAIELALQWEVEPLPGALRERLLAGGADWLSSKTGAAAAATTATPARRRTAARSLPWLLAAACLLLAVVAWWSRLQPVADPASRRAALLSEAPDATVLPWQSNNAGITGDVVWSTERQEGYVRIAGLPVNDPSALQYQLWIFDAARHGLQAVSGGVFDVDRGAGEVVIPLAAGLKVTKPSLFAVTTEPPGGVVQHDDALGAEYRIILTAPAG